MNIYYYFNVQKRQERNGNGLDYPACYMPSVLKFMGIDADVFSGQKLDADDILFVCAEKTDFTPDCRVITLGTAPAERIEKVFTHINGIPLFVPLEDAPGGDVILRDENGLPAVVKTENGYHFCFDLVSSVWFSSDGYPAKCDYFFIGRIPDARPLKDEFSPPPFNDMLIAFLEDILKEMGVPSVYRLPPKDNTVPDSVIHFSGDDDCTSKDLNIEAAKNMHTYGFPYHINAMVGKTGDFVFDKNIYDELSALGCEVALHLNFADGYEYSDKTVKDQALLFEKKFGVKPYTNVNHCLIQEGSVHKRLRALSECKIAADNSNLGIFDKTDINAFDLTGFGYGSAFPRFVCDNAEHGNVPLYTLEIPITYYEARVIDGNTSKIKSYIDGAVQNGRIIQFFFHPHYISSYYKQKQQRTTDALEFIKEYTKNFNVMFSTTDSIAKFWHARAGVKIKTDGECINVSSQIPIVISLPPCYKDKRVTVDGITATPEIKNGNILLPVDAGKHTIKKLS